MYDSIFWLITQYNWNQTITTAVIKKLEHTFMTSEVKMLFNLSGGREFKLHLVAVGLNTSDSAINLKALETFKYAQYTVQYCWYDGVYGGKKMNAKIK